MHLYGQDGSLTPPAVTSVFNIRPHQLKNGRDREIRVNQYNTKKYLEHI